MFCLKGPCVFFSPSSITVGHKLLHKGSLKPGPEGRKLQTSFSPKLSAKVELCIREMGKTWSKTGSGNVLLFSSCISQSFLLWGYLRRCLLFHLCLKAKRPAPACSVTFRKSLNLCINFLISKVRILYNEITCGKCKTCLLLFFLEW